MGNQRMHPVARVGIADDQGVLHVGGRVGAARGPSAFTEHWNRLRPDPDQSITVLNCGDLQLPLAQGRSGIESSRLHIAAAHAAAERVLVIGGGNDHAWAQVAALGTPRLGCINIDAHLDLRPLTPAGQVTSGSPFRLLIEDGIVNPRRLVEFGIQRLSNAPELWNYARSQRLEIHEWETLKAAARKRLSIAQSFARALSALCRRSDAVAVCLDLDLISAAEAPGVSAPTVDGLSTREAIEIVQIAALEPRVRSLGIYELNPALDPDGRTARLAATLAWHWVQGAAKHAQFQSQPKSLRPKGSKKNRQSR